MIKQTMAILMLAAMAIMSVGCCDKTPRKYTVNVSLDDEMVKSLATRKIEVDLVGVQEGENKRWEGYSMGQYWQPGDTLRNSQPTYVMTFDPAHPQPQTLSKDNPIWNTWLKGGANRLYVLALLPGMRADAEGDKDPRRQIEPLACYRWTEHNGVIDIKIQPAGVTTVSQLRPEH